MRTFSLLSLLLLSHFAISQETFSGSGFTCRNHDLEEMELLRTTDPVNWQGALEARSILDLRTATFGSEGLRGGETTYVIPVVFHIIHDNGPENISDAQVQDAIRILNDDLNRLNAD